MIYADNASTTWLSDSAKTAMEQVSHLYANPNSLHKSGKAAGKILEKAKAQMAKILGVNSGQIVLTQGGTDANRRVISVFARRFGLSSVFASHFEHSSIRDFVPEKNHFNPLLEQEISQAKLICQMHANNETGIILPDVPKKEGRFWLQDWVQGFGKIKFDFTNSGADFVSISAHKFHGPKNVGILVVREPNLWPEIMEDHRTINLSLAVGMAAAMTENKDYKAKNEYLKMLSETFESYFADNPHFKIHHHDKQRIPGIISLATRNVRGSEIMAKLSEEEDMMVSTGSACNRDLLSPTPVIRAMGVLPEWSFPLRISFSQKNTKEEVIEVAEAISHYA